MGAIGAESVEVALGHDPAAVEHQKPVGIGGIQHLLHRVRLLANGELDLAEVLVVARKLAWSSRAGDAGVGDEFTQMLEGPPVERRFLPVGQRHQ